MEIIESDKNKTSKKVGLSSSSEPPEADDNYCTDLNPGSEPRVPSEVNHLASSGARLPTLMALLISDASYNVRDRQTGERSPDYLSKTI